MAWVLLFVMTMLSALLAMAFYTLFERKVLGLAQVRKGPSKVGIGGLPQPLADALKLFLKQQLVPSVANRLGFLFASTGSLVIALSLWVIYPHMGVGWVMSFGAFFFLVVSGLNVYTLLAAGWSSNSKYALLGAVRGIAQTVSYEVTMALFLLGGLILMNSYNFFSPLFERWSWLGLLVFPLSVCWFVTVLAETNRTPFDFAEGESELVSGFNVEYGGARFAFIFMAEYLNILLISSLTSGMFGSGLGGSWGGGVILVLGGVVVSGMFVGVRATLPRMRYDWLMLLTWKSYLPFALFLCLMLMPLSIFVG